jgi:hypothetical protein
MKYLFATLLFLLLISTKVFAQQSENIYGVWANRDGEFVEILDDDTFTRYKIKEGTKDILSQGFIDYEDRSMNITRTDTVNEYSLDYFIGNENLIIQKPYEIDAWLWEKIYDY